MPALDRDTSALLVVDFQTRLMPAIEDSAAVVANARRLLDAGSCPSRWWKSGWSLRWPLVRRPWVEVWPARRRSAAV